MYKKLKKAKSRLVILFLNEIIVAVACVIVYILLKNTVTLIGTYGIYFFVAYLLLINIINILAISSHMNRVDRILNRTDINVASVFGNEVSSLFEFGELAFFVYNDDDEIIWCNNSTRIRKSSVVGKNIHSIIPDFDTIIEEDENNLYTNIDGRKFLIKINRPLKVVYLKDVTIDELQKADIEESTPFIGHIIIDNYQDVFTSYAEADFLSLVAKIKDKIMAWGKENNLFVRSYGNDSFLLLGEDKSYRAIKENNFAILDEVRTLMAKEDYPLTISIGIGKGHTNLLRKSELANIAFNMALSRGGDQAVVNTYGYPLEYYGSKVEVKKGRSHVRGRVMATALANLIKEAKEVLIMGHKDLDFDALGACLGIYAICESLETKAYIVYEDALADLQTRRAFKTVFLTQDVAKMCVSPSKALNMAGDGTLLVILDVHIPALTMQPLLLERCKDVCVIDHHLRSDVFINNPVFTYHEPLASSSSELVTELIYYQPNKVELTQEMANFLLAGICLDTRFFTASASSKTFEMSMVLRNYNASVEAVNEFFKEEYEEKMLLNSIINNSKTPFTGVVVTKVDEEYIVTKAVLAKAAEDILNTKSINAVFVLGRIAEKTIGISARSLPTFNVQIIMENMEGGGHFTGAATQINTTDSIDSIIIKLNELIGLYIRDGRI